MRNVKNARSGLEPWESFRSMPKELPKKWRSFEDEVENSIKKRFFFLSCFSFFFKLFYAASLGVVAPVISHNLGLLIHPPFI